MTLKKTALILGACSLIPSIALAADENKTTTLVYPAPAAEIELDNSTPAKRATPPVREESEFDPVTPLGQIQAVKGALDRIEAAQEEVKNELRKSARTLSDDEGFLSRFNSLFPLIERTAAEGEETKANVETLAKTTDGIAAKIDALQKTTENLRATVEAAQKTAASVEKIRTSRWTDFAVIAILAVVVLQLGGRIVSFFVGIYKTSRERLEAEIYERAQAIVNAKKTTSATTPTTAEKAKK